MGYSEFVEWLAFYEVEPFGETRGDLHNAALAAVIVNANRGKKGKAAKVSQFLVDWWKDASKSQSLLAKFRAATARIPAETQKAKSGTRSGNAGRRASSRNG